MRLDYSKVMRSGARVVVLAALLMHGFSMVLDAGEVRRSLLLITIDTLRADHLSCNGSKDVKTPHLDRLAAGGVNFRRARTTAPLTLPAHASIMTGLDPPEHGVRDNGSYRLPEDRLTLAETLAERGYETAAFVGAFVLEHRFGLDQGFDLYDDDVGTDEAMLESLEAERDADAVVSVFSGWLDERDAEVPFFAWVHIYDPHAPYTPPEPYRSRYAGDPYAGEVAFADAAVGTMIAGLESKNLLGSTVVAVVGDHGEGLGEHDEATHSVLVYNSTSHVPMLAHAPGLISAGTAVPQLVRVIDLAPTLLDYLGLEPSLGRGVSLRPLVEGGATRDPWTAYSESLYPRLNLGWSELRAVESGTHRYILAPREELYDLAVDPGETVNRAAELPEVAAALRRLLEDTISADVAPDRAAHGAVDAETRAMLEKLGYLSKSGTPRTEDSPADPKDRIAVWNRIQHGLFLSGRGDHAGALVILNRALTSEPDMPILYESIGSSYMRLGRYEEAERVYRRALERGIDSPDVRLNLGVIRYRRGDLNTAEQELRRALALKESGVEAHYRLADVYQAQKRYAQAVEHYRRALEINPRYIYAWNGLGMALALQGDGAKALDAFHEVVRLDPDQPRGYLNLAVHLERMRRIEEALETYRKFMSLAGEQEFARERRIAAEAIDRLQP
jgi:pentatricopeptide repeat protein